MHGSINQSHEARFVAVGMHQAQHMARRPAHTADVWGTPWVCQASSQTPPASAAALVCGVARRMTFLPRQAPQDTSPAVRRGLDSAYRSSSIPRQFPVKYRVSKSCVLFLLTICAILWNLIASTVVLNATCFHRLVCTLHNYANGLVLYHPQLRFRVRGGKERERH